MPFKTNQAQAVGFARAIDQAAWIKGRAQAAVLQLQGNVNSDQVFQMMDDLRSAISLFNAVSAIPGIGAYAQAQYNDNTYDVVAAFTGMVNAINAVVSWVVTNFPAGTGGFLQAYKINADGSRVPTVFTPAQTAGLTTALNNVIAQIA